MPKCKSLGGLIGGEVVRLGALSFRDTDFTCDLEQGHQGPHWDATQNQEWATFYDRLRIHKEWKASLDQHGSGAVGGVKHHLLRCWLQWGGDMDGCHVLRSTWEQLDTPDSIE